MNRHLSASGNTIAGDLPLFSRPHFDDAEIGELAREVLTILEHHKGEGNAISARDLAARFGMRSDRKVRKAIEQLVGDGHQCGGLA